jgi:hypothetical protein
VSQHVALLEMSGANAVELTAQMFFEAEARTLIGRSQLAH